MMQVPRSVHILAPMVDYFAEIDNPPNAEDVRLVKPEGSTWEEFKRQWIQYVHCLAAIPGLVHFAMPPLTCVYFIFVPRTVAYVPNRKKLLEKAQKAKLRLESAGGSSISTISSADDRTI